MIPYDSSRASLLDPGRGRTWFARGVPDDLEAIAGEASRLAYLHGEESAQEHRRLASALALAGFGEPVPFHHRESDGQGYAALREDGLAVVAFRGTEPRRLQDLATDLQVFPTAWELGGGKVHAGFAASALGLWREVKAWLAGPGAPRQRLVLCGHSLGGAVATLLALPSGADELVTFGCPRVGNAEFAASLSAAPGTRVRRIVNCCDGVTENPPAWFGFKHAGGILYLDRQGGIHRNPTREFIRSDRLQARWSYARDHLLSPGALPARDLADHSPVNYLRAFWR